MKSFLAIQREHAITNSIRAGSVETTLRLVTLAHWQSNRPDECNSVQTQPNQYTRCNIGRCLVRYQRQAPNPKLRSAYIYARTSSLKECTKLLLLFSRLYDVSTSSCTHLTIILYSSSSCLCHSSLLPLIPFPPSVL